MDKVLKLARTRRHHSEEFKQVVVAACCTPGASIAGMALAHGVNANLARRWMAERGLTPPRAKRTASVPQSCEPAAAFIPVHVQQPAPTSPRIQIEMRRGDTALTVSWPIEAAGACASWLGAWLP